MFTAGVENDDVHFDDVIIAESVANYANGRLEEDEAGEFNWLREIHQVNANSSLLSTAASVTRDSGICRDINDELVDKNLRDGRNNVKFRTAKTVCGPFVIASGKIVEALEKYQDMENA